MDTEEEGEQEKMRQKSRKRGSNPASGFFSKLDFKVEVSSLGATSGIAGPGLAKNG